MRTSGEEPKPCSSDLRLRKLSSVILIPHSQEKIMVIQWFAGVALAGCITSLACAQTGTNAEIEEHIEHVQAGLLPQVVVVKSGTQAAPQTHTLSERMAALHVPGVSIAVVHHGQIEWARGFGFATEGTTRVTADTMFQAGSISKPLAAMAALRLVQQGKLTLDTDVNKTLTSWKLPASKAADGKPVTLRELLTHTGGTTVHGFPGYAKGEHVPTLVQVLNGEKPANTPAIVIAAEPGSRWNYSGGGYTIMQQMLIDVTHEPFPKLLHDTVLEPIGMTHSTYEQPLPDKFSSEAATPYDGKGSPIAGGPHTYPEMAAAGLWTTPTDLARYILEVQTSLHGKSNKVLTQSMTKQMVTPGQGSWGLGLEIGGSTPNPYFSHGGDDAGFVSLFVGYESNGDGAVVMTNAQDGGEIAAEVMRSIAAEYHWPDWKPTVRKAIDVDPKLLSSYVGDYQLAPNFILTITVENGHLESQATGQPKFALDAESPTTFFPEEFDAEIEFVKDATGNVTGIILHQGGQDHKAPKQHTSHTP
jgi:CubicO group peptidase (beta-lactamase class C family)